MPPTIAHISDLHLPTRPLPWRLRDFFSKRRTGWVNLRLLGRAKRFRHAPAVLRQLVRELHDRRVSHVLFSGDASMLGFPREFEAVAEALGLQSPTPLPGMAVPGNHDYYTPREARSGAFERAFAPWQQGVRLDASQVYPFAQQVAGVWFVAVNSSRPNPIAWDARGEVGGAQRERLEALLQSLPPGPRVLVTHYPLVLADGSPEGRWRLLRDAEPMRALCTRRGICLWLHGHRHHRYLFDDRTRLSFPCVCVGSSTQTGRWTYHEYQFTESGVAVLPRQYDPARGQFGDGTPAHLSLTPASGNLSSTV